MRHLFVMDPLDRLNFAHDSTWMMMRECSRRQDEVAWCEPSALYAHKGRSHARAQRVIALPHPPFFETGDWSDAPLDDYQVVWMRKDPPFDMSYIFATYLLSLCNSLVVNEARGLRDRNEKLFAFHYTGFSPETLITSEIPRIQAFAASQAGKIVLKPWDGNGGRGVLVTQHGDPNLRSMAEILTQEGRQAIIAQRYLPQIVDGDKRILLVEGEPVGAMLRVPTATDHRGNMHAGAAVVRTPLSDREREICAAIGPTLRKEGFVFVGIDVIGGWLTEINVTSPTGIQDINRLEGLRLEETLYEAVLRRLGR